MMFLRMPPEELMQDLPEGATVESVLKTWHAGFALGYQRKAYHDMERLELQHVLADGYHRGQTERALDDELNEAGAWETPEGPKALLARLKDLSPWVSLGAAAVAAVGWGLAALLAILRR